MRLHFVAMELGRQAHEYGNGPERRITMPPITIDSPPPIGNGNDEITAPGGEPGQDATSCYDIITTDSYGNEWVKPPPDGLTPGELADHIKNWAYKGPDAKPIILPDYKYA